ncbi:PKD domain-containing protein [Actinotalea sp. AC32]|nr:PKD domain-containing protein [Actinotalea sp. AC32]
MRARPALVPLTAAALAVAAALGGGGAVAMRDGVAAGPAPGVVDAAVQARAQVQVEDQVQAAAVAGGVHLTAAGDIGATSNTWAVLDSVRALDPDAMLVLGDLSYGQTGAEQAWCDQVVARVGAGFAFQLVAGNHEMNGLNGNINDFSACLPNQLPGLVGTYGREWYVDVPAQDPLVRVVMVSPALDFPGQARWEYTAGSPHYAWTEAAIDGARAAGVPWVVVGMHHPCLSVGTYSCLSGSDLNDLLLSKRVDLVLSGHEHLYQRTHQLALGGACPTVVPGAAADLDCVVDADPTMVRGAGTVFATVGTGGIQQRAVATGDPEEPYFATANGLATASWGVLDLQVTAEELSARFVRASGAAFSDAFTLRAADPGTNTPPVARATVSCTGRTCAFDGSSSSDGDGTVTAWAWDLGDGATASGATTTHTYATDGSFTARLTVTDDDGATATVQRVVEVAAPSAVFAADTFTRDLARGWGSAEAGGAWRTSGSLDLYSVSGGAGRIRLAAPGVGPDVSLPATAASADLVQTFRVDKLPAGGSGLYLYPSPRRVAGVGEYRSKVQLRGDGRVVLSLVRVTGATQTALTAATLLTGPVVAPGEGLLVRTQAVGTNPTTVRVRAWEEGTPEPTSWNATVTDATAGLQAAGSTGLNTYLSSAVTSAPIVLTLDDVRAVVP